MELEKKLMELQSDFSEIFDKMDFMGYNPMSETAQKVINIGLIWLLADKIKAKEEHAIHKVKDHIEDELMSAEDYYEKWLNEKDSTLKQMVKDELKHADYFIKQSRMIAKNVEEQAKIQRYIAWYNGLLQKVSE